jgi:RsiW-degrading membrane proteinase PrsW (M82 family)
MAFVAAIIALLPGFAWLYFYLQEDPYPAPKSLVAKTFVAGGASAFIALAAQIGLQKLGFSFGAEGGTYAASGILILTIIVFSLVEELAKFGAAYVTVHGDPGFDEPLDAMIYAIVAALGFATIENIGAVQHDLIISSSGTVFAAIFQTLTLRFIGATLLHTISSGLIGYYWALHIRKFGSGYMLPMGIVLATLLHAMFNFLIINYGSLMYAVAFVVVMAITVLTDFERLRERHI